MGGFKRGEGHTRGAEGVKETTKQEDRVGMTPAAVGWLTALVHDVFFETKAGEGIGLHNEMYERVGARILPNADEVFSSADMIKRDTRFGSFPLCSRKGFG